ncbi:hypothetical protein W97_04401 [Coniosporium apollinis CBS 100218]|uniref:THUMP domain-containing protein n=1 Tax=Coniosporium apollinis (strain CBS 100218) TaxID=1168221 RepID=R7YTN2_CONA1|nr:uncharacterized protein W97_04401 [Coniosporium apollinis CBS 100218]EON65164.1 hypothetical protein W97_04401 [Coniosporium apollinis CBS 100218]
MADALKRKAPVYDGEAPAKKAKARKQWRTPHQRDSGTAIEPGDAGIWASCNMGREGKCVAELKDCFEEYARALYGDQEGDSAAEKREGAEVDDIEAEIRREVEDIRKPTTAPLFSNIRLDGDCIMFFKTRPPLEPVSFVRKICEDAASSSGRKQSRFVKRLTPMTLMGKATWESMDEVAQQVLAPHFHQPNGLPKKFAIRPNIRNHKILTREGIIKRVAAAVGPGHKVDLKEFDLLILVDVYKNVCGMSVVGNDYEKLKRYNLSEIYEPTPKAATN